MTHKYTLKTAAGHS